jgi:hypothetical protein
VGPFALADAVEPATLTAANLAEAMRSPLEALTDLASVQLTEQESGQIAHGIAIRPDATRLAAGYLGEYKALDPTGKLIAILSARPGGGLAPVRNFPLA